VRSTIGVDVSAPPELVFRLARDIERWPRLLPHYVRVRPLERGDDGRLVAEMIARRVLVPVLGLGVPVAWRARTWSEEERFRLRFVHVGGATGGMDVTWRIEGTDTGCRVSIDHDFRPRIPGWGWAIDRLFVKPIARRTLATFKSIAEAVAASAAGSGSSLRPNRTVS
jgi:ribosome-associated toxin RatA of RatAB toxin-antitoxin module